MPKMVQTDELLAYASTVLINLPTRHDRLRDSMDELRRLAVREIAIGSEIEIIRPRRFEQEGGFASTAHRSRLDAHLQAALWARGRGVERLLVLEDDFRFDPRWSDLGPRMLAELHETDWDIANLGFIGEAVECSSTLR